jgi:hypothetical protein
MFETKTVFGLAGGLLLALGLAACNGGGSSAGGGETPPTVTTTVSGVAMAGPFSSGQVCAYKVSAAGGQGDQLACAAIDPANSGFSVTFSDYTGGIVLGLLGGAVYDDEATPGVDATVLTAPLRSFVTVEGGPVGVAITPLTEAAIRLAGGFNATAIQNAAQQLAAAYGLTGNGLNLFTTLPQIVSTDTLQEAYRQALGFMSALQAGSGVNLDAYIGNLALIDPVAYAQAVQAHIDAHLPAHCTFSAATFVCTLPTSGGGGDNGGGGNGGATGNYRLNLTVTTSMGVPMPAVVVENVPKPNTQDEFCNDVTVVQQIQAINAANPGATLTITSCSFSGNNGSISAVINMTSPIVMSIDYSVLYAYSPM